MLFIISKQTVLTMASGNSRQGRPDFNGFLMGFWEEEIFRVTSMFRHHFYFPVNIYSCKQRNRCNQTVPTKISQDYPRPMLWDSIDLTKKSAATRSLNNIIPVLYIPCHPHLKNINLFLTSNELITCNYLYNYR